MAPASEASEGPAGGDAAGGRSRAATAVLLATRDLHTVPRDFATLLPGLLGAMNDIGTGSVPDLRATLERIVSTAAALADCRYAAIGVLDEERRGLRHFATHGATPEDAARIGHRPDGRHGLLAVVLDQEEPLRLDDLTADPRSCGFPPGHPPMRSFLGFPVKAGEDHVGNLYLTEKHGGGPFTDNDVLLIRVLATEAGIALRNARLHEEARQRQRWIEGCVAVTTSLLGGDTDDALAVVAERARHLAEAEAGVVLLPTPERGLEIVAASADDTRGLLGTVMPPGATAVERLLAGEAVVVTDSSTDPLMVTPVRTRFGPSMMLPLSSGGRVLGALAVPRAHGAEPFTPTEQRLAGQFAAQAALAFVLAEAQADREKLAVYRDRDRIARDLHDLVIQRLFATGMTLQGAQRRAEIAAAAAPAAPESGEGADVADRIGTAVDELDATIAEIRTAIFALQQDPGEAQAGLRTRVLREVGLAAVPLGFTPSVHFTGAVDARVGERTAKELVAALREALSNATRHARASRIQVTVDATVLLPPDDAPGVRLSVADDGVGIPDGGRRSGLANLARRAENLGGTASWGPGPGAGDTPGTTLTWQVRL